MIGPLPKLHRLLLVTTVLIVSIASGAWITRFAELPMAATAGAGAFLGAIAGLVLAFAMVHDFSHRARPIHLARRH